MIAMRNRVALASLTAATVLVLGLAGCSPQTAPVEGDTRPEGNDTAVAGEYVPYDPAKEAEITAGKAIEGSEEEELQQERIAGGAVGGVVSQNLEPLEGVVDGSEGEYRPITGLDLEPPLMGHGNNGSECLSCHESDGGGATMPLSHESANLANEECASCHKAAK